MSNFKDFVSSKVFLVLGSSLLIFLLVIQIKQFREKSNVQKEIEELSKQANELQKSNQQLEGFISYLQTENYKQKAAREQLNLKKEGEFVYTFASNQNSLTEEESALESSSKEISNLRKWFKYFFNNS